MEFDDAERQGGFDILWHLPETKNVVLGLVSTKRAELEDLETIKSQVVEAAEVIAKCRRTSTEIALDCLAISPQCGFSSLSVIKKGGNAPE